MRIPHQVDWREIEDFSEWIVSEHGEVMNQWTSKVISQRVNQQSVVMTNLYKEGKIHTRSVALLVANAFLDPPSHPDIYNSVIHLNGDREDCRAMNLMWRPRWFVIRYHKMFEEEPFRVSVFIPYLNKVFYSLREFCTIYGLIERHTYMAMLNNDPCFHYGWKIERHEK